MTWHLPNHAVRASFNMRELQRSSDKAQLYGYFRTLHSLAFSLPLQLAPVLKLVFMHLNVKLRDTGQ